MVRFILAFGGFVLTKNWIFLHLAAAFAAYGFPFTIFLNDLLP
jgi:hypothetical protein